MPCKYITVTMFVLKLQLLRLEHSGKWI